MVTVADTPLDGRCPDGNIASRWDQRKRDLKLVAPNNKRKYTIIVVGTGLAGGSAAASLAELGYNVLSFCIQDTPRRAHSIAAQGESMQRKTIKTMGIPSGGYFTTPSRVASGVLGNPTFIVLPASVRRLSTSASHRVSLLLVNMVGHSPIALSAVPKFLVHFIVVGKQDNNCC